MRYLLVYQEGFRCSIIMWCYAITKKIATIKIKPSSQVFNRKLRNSHFRYLFSIFVFIWLCQSMIVIMSIVGQTYFWAVFLSFRTTLHFPFLNWCPLKSSLLIFSPPPTLHLVSSFSPVSFSPSLICKDNAHLSGRWPEQTLASCELCCCAARLIPAPPPSSSLLAPSLWGYLILM